jgi:hypothetical protein
VSRFICGLRRRGEQQQDWYELAPHAVTRMQSPCRIHY